MDTTSSCTNSILGKVNIGSMTLVAVVSSCNGQGDAGINGTAVALALPMTA